MDGDSHVICRYNYASPPARFAHLCTKLPRGRNRHSLGKTFGSAKSRDAALVVKIMRKSGGCGLGLRSKSWYFESIPINVLFTILIVNSNAYFYFCPIHLINESLLTSGSYYPYPAWLCDGVSHARQQQTSPYYMQRQSFGTDA